VCVLAAKIVAERPVIVTLLVPHHQKTFEKSQQEVARCLSDMESPAGTIRYVITESLFSSMRLIYYRIIAMGDLATDFSSLMQPDISAFQDFWNKCLHSLPITCSATGTEYPGIPKPSLFFIDSVQYDLLAHVRATDTSPPTAVLTWMMAFLGTLVTLTFPKKYGGCLEIMLPEFTEEEIAKGRLMKVDGEIKHVRGLPDMYDWEAHPQDLSYIPMFKDQDRISHPFNKFIRYVP
jgi:hypothetical protein